MGVEVAIDSAAAISKVTISNVLIIQITLISTHNLVNSSLSLQPLDIRGPLQEEATRRRINCPQPRQLTTTSLSLALGGCLTTTVPGHPPIVASVLNMTNTGLREVWED